MTQIVEKLFSIHHAHSIPERDHLIDFLRGGAMILVLLHHSGFPLGSFILALHMPLFFLLSGYLSSWGADMPFNRYFWKKFVRLVVPYFTFEALNLIIWCVKCVMEHRAAPGIESVFSIVTCINNSYMGLYGRLWFLPCMFVADLYVWVILRLLCKYKFAQILSILLLFSLSFVTDKLIPFRLPFTIDTALFAAAFIMLGYLFCDAIRMIIDKGNDVCKIILTIVMLLYLAYSVKYTDVKVHMYINSYGEYTVSICAAIAGSVAFLILGSYMYRAVSRLQLLYDFVLWYGNNSLVSFPIHLTIKMLILWYVPILSKWYLLFGIMLILNIPIVNLTTNYLPFMLGKKYVREP